MDLFKVLCMVTILCGFLEASFSYQHLKTRKLGILSNFKHDLERRMLERRAHERRVSEHLLHKKASDPECGSRPVDLGLVLDESGSIWGPDFEKQLAFVNDLIDSFKVGEHNSHISVLTFSNNTKIHMYLDEYLDNPAEMKNVVGSIGQRRGNTRTDLALSSLRLELFNKSYARDNVPHIAIVITDGESQYPQKTEREAELVKDAGITVFAIGVGRDVIDVELDAIASGPDFVYKVDKYQDLLETLKDIIPEKACEVTVPPTTTTVQPPPQMIEGCDGQRPLDVLFSVPDEAGIRDTELTLEFLNGVIEGFKIGPSRVQVGLTPKLCVDQESIAIGENDNMESLLDKIADRRLESTLLGQQLEYILAKGLTIEDGARLFAKDAAILLVDNEAEDPAQVALLAEKAKSDGITLIFVGIGDYVNMPFLQDLASSQQHAFFVQSYEELIEPNSTLIEDIHDLLCSEVTNPGPTTPVPRPPQSIFGCNGSQATDILLSAADEAGIIDTQYTLDFFESLIDNFTISSTQVQVGMTPRLCGDLDEIRLKDTDTKDTLQTAIGDRSLGSTLLSKQLDYLLDQGFSPNDGARPNAKKIAIMVVDNKSQDPHLVEELASEAKQAGIVLIIIGVGDFVDMGELVEVASSDRHVFHVDMFEELMSLKGALLTAICTGATP